MAITNPVLSVLTAADFREFFGIGFDCGDIANDQIEIVYKEANYQINPKLFTDDDDLKIAFMYLTAHCLSLKYRATGVNSVGENVVGGSGVNGISVSFVIPEHIAQKPQFAQFNLTQYGQKYLSILYPRLVGNVGIAMGTTTP